MIAEFTKREKILYFSKLWTYSTLAALKSKPEASELRSDEASLLLKMPEVKNKDAISLIV